MPGGADEGVCVDQDKSEDCVAQCDINTDCENDGTTEIVPKDATVTSSVSVEDIPDETKDEKVNSEQHSTLTGKLKLKPFASLVDPKVPESATTLIGGSSSVVLSNRNQQPKDAHTPIIYTPNHHVTNVSTQRPHELKQIIMPPQESYVGLNTAVGSTLLANHYQQRNGVLFKPGRHEVGGRLGAVYNGNWAARHQVVPLVYSGGAKPRFNPFQLPGPRSKSDNIGRFYETHPHLLTKQPASISTQPSYSPEQIKLPKGTSITKHTKSPYVLSDKGYVSVNEVLPIAVIPNEKQVDQKTISSEPVQAANTNIIDSSPIDVPKDMENGLQTEFDNVIVKCEVDLGTNITENEDIKPDNINTDSTFGTHFLIHKEESVTEGTSNTTEKGDESQSADEEKAEPAENDVHKSPGKHKCRMCDFSSNSQVTLKRHNQEVHVAAPALRCLICGPKTINFKSTEFLKHHVATVHRGEKRWQCAKCGKGYKEKLTYNKHIATKCVTINPYACHECSYTCKSSEALANHRRRHLQANELIKCPNCSKNIKRDYMKAHLFVVHSTNKPHKCEACNYSSVRKCDLKSHYRKTLHNKPYKCLMCSIGFGMEEFLIRHMCRVHDQKIKKTMIPCGFPGCNKKWSSQKLLDLHSRVHTIPDSEFYHCVNKECDYKAIYKASLDRHYHKTKHHREFKCPDCSLRFCKEASLAKHIQTIHVKNIMKDRGTTSEKNKNDEYESTSTPYEEEYYDDSEEARVANFGIGWLGISGFGGDEALTEVGTDPVEENCPTSSNQETEGKIADVAFFTQVCAPELLCVVPEISLPECSGESSKEPIQELNSLNERVKTDMMDIENIKEEEEEECDEIPIEDNLTYDPLKVEMDEGL